MQNKVEEVVQEALKDWLSTGQLVERSNKKKEKREGVTESEGGDMATTT